MKIRFIYSKLWKTLRATDCRTRFNLWTIFVGPLMRMTLSMVGFSDIYLGKKVVEEISIFARKSIKKFLLAPKSAPNLIIDFMNKFDPTACKEIVESQLEKAFTHTQEIREVI